MSIRKYKAFSTIVDEGSVTAAASKIGISQSALTQLLNSLEAELGVKLLIRNRSGIKLTAEGSKLLPLINKVLAADSEVKKAVASIGGAAAESVTIKIGSFTSVAVNWLPEIMREFSKEEPNVRIELVDDGYNNIEKSFRENPIDFGFVRLPLDFECKTIPLYNDRLLAVLPADFDLSKLLKSPKSGESSAQFYSCPVSLFETEPVISLIKTIDRDAKTVFSSEGITPNIRYRVEDDYALLAMVEKGLGIAIVPELMLKDTKRNVMCVELDPPTSRRIGIAFPDYSSLSDSAMKFVEFTRRFLS